MKFLGNLKTKNVINSERMIFRNAKTYLLGKFSLFAYIIGKHLFETEFII